MRSLYISPLNWLSERRVENVNCRHRGVAQHSQGPGQSAGVVTLVLQAGFVEGQVTDQTPSLLLPPGGDHHAPPVSVLVEHHLLHLPGRAEGPDEAGVVEGPVSHLTPQSDLGPLVATQSTTALLH